MPRRESKIIRAMQDGRVLTEVVREQWRERGAMLDRLSQAEDTALLTLPHTAFVTARMALEAVTAVQGRAGRIRGAALRDFAIIVWGREVGFLG